MKFDKFWGNGRERQVGPKRVFIIHAGPLFE